MYYRNQRMIEINRESVKKTTNRKFLVCYIDNIERAEKELSKTAFQVYIYLLCNRDGFELEYSPAHISLKTGMCLESARKSFQELQKHGYLVENKENKHYFNFYEKPIAREEVREICNPITGEIMTLSYQETLNQFGIQGILLWGGSEDED